ncbi:RNA-dependent RNA polymerase family protein [Bradyrhizobium sp. 195]|uniref:hypothetical protein n=1 Tax=Bradyrhizobium sp. 195 TaxID=2782662 RepID=UPI00200082EB|nr:hypothetical protein [Bradyrhizobium sp. 195]UPK28256.1 hypothetical protein IVB26_07280 [Bradyrhizobium sp. 195]
MKAYKPVKDNAGAAVVDKVSFEAFEKDLKGNLYKVWNRMSSGGYFPPAVRAVPIPKKNGGQRILGVPTVADRAAQTVINLQIEQALESCIMRSIHGWRYSNAAAARSLQPVERQDVAGQRDRKQGSGRLMIMSCRSDRAANRRRAKSTKW